MGSQYFCLNRHGCVSESNPLIKGGEKLQIILDSLPAIRSVSLERRCTLSDSTENEMDSFEFRIEGIFKRGTENRCCGSVVIRTSTLSGDTHCQYKRRKIFKQKFFLSFPWENVLCLSADGVSHNTNRSIKGYKWHY
jgi:hypothetical protein